MKTPINHIVGFALSQDSQMHHGESDVDKLSNLLSEIRQDAKQLENNQDDAFKNKIKEIISKKLDDIEKLYLKLNNDKNKNYRLESY